MNFLSQYQGLCIRFIRCIEAVFQMAVLIMVIPLFFDGSNLWMQQALPIFLFTVFLLWGTYFIMLQQAYIPERIGSAVSYLFAGLLPIIPFMFEQGRIVDAAVFSFASTTLTLTILLCALLIFLLIKKQPAWLIGVILLFVSCFLLFTRYIFTEVNALGQASLTPYLFFIFFLAPSIRAAIVHAQRLREKEIPDPQYELPGWFLVGGLCLSITVGSLRILF